MNINNMRTSKQILTFLLFLLSISSFAQETTVIDLNTTHQIIRGFGAANILRWRPDMTDSEIETAFGTGDGQLGFSILRLRIHPDSDEWHYNVPAASKAHEMGVTIIAAPWNPPEEMIETIGGNTRLYHDMYEDYAYHLDDFSYYMEDNGAPLYGVSVQNEPDIGEWTQWSVNEMLNFMRDYAHLITSTKVMGPESFCFNKSYSDPILNDSLACANLDIVCGHIYGGGLEPYPLAVKKGKEVWMTEHLSGENSHSNDWSWAYQIATEINNVMHAGMNAYVWWYLVRYYGPISDGTNSCGNKGDVTKKGCVMSQFSRFVRPGYFRIGCKKRFQSQVYGSAYIDDKSSKVVIVAINTSHETKDQTFTFQNGAVEKFSPYVTSETKNCNQENDILAVNESLTVTLDARSITTFVSTGEVTVSGVNSSFSRPASFKLFQNYPNPFNPATEIQFTLKKAGYARLTVYDVLGHEVATLLNGHHAAGSHFLSFDASGLGSGVYLYKLDTGDQHLLRKMMLAK